VKLRVYVRRGQKARGAALLGGLLPGWRNFWDAEAQRYPAGKPGTDGTFHWFSVNHPLGVGSEQELPPISTPRHMMRNIRDDHPRHSSRDREDCRIRSVCPRFSMKFEDAVKAIAKAKPEPKKPKRAK
jgi:hypothetical protein